MNIVFQNLLKNLMSKNPQGYQMVNQLMNNNGDPEGALKQILGNTSPEQRQQILNQAKSYGCPEKILSKVQNMK